MRMIVVTDKKGRVIGATHPPPDEAEVMWGFRISSEQMLHEVDIPDHLKTLEPDERLRQALAHEVVAKTKLLRLRKAKKI